MASFSEHVVMGVNVSLYGHIVVSRKTKYFGTCGRALLGSDKVPSLLGIFDGPRRVIVYGSL